MLFILTDEAPKCLSLGGKLLTINPPYQGPWGLIYNITWEAPHSSDDPRQAWTFKVDPNTQQYFIESHHYSVRTIENTRFILTPP